jgi:hypothetical protein
MTPTEILAMPAGRELDDLVAQEVMGWIDRKHWPRWNLPIGARHEGSTTATSAPSYSTDIEAAWLVIAQIRCLFPEQTRSSTFSVQVCQMGCNGEWEVTFSTKDGDWTHQPRVRSYSAPLAICQAALIGVLEK